MSAGRRLSSRYFQSCRCLAHQHIVEAIMSDDVGLPFICITRQTGISIPTLSRALTKSLNQAEQEVRVHWMSWDTELVAKIAEEMHVSAELVEQSEGPYSWIDDFLSTLADRTDLMAIFRRLSRVIRGLAGNGGAILVGHGSHFFTRGMPGGIHIRLVAPWQARVRTIARAYNLSSERAESQAQAIAPAAHRIFQAILAGLLPGSRGVFRDPQCGPFDRDTACGSYSDSGHASGKKPGVSLNEKLSFRRGSYRILSSSIASPVSGDDPSAGCCNSPDYLQSVATSADSGAATSNREDSWLRPLTQS